VRGIVRLKIKIVKKSCSDLAARGRNTSSIDAERPVLVNLGHQQAEDEDAVPPSDGQREPDEEPSGPSSAEAINPTTYEPLSW
jgi:hypothetical protein